MDSDQPNIFEVAKIVNENLEKLEKDDRVKVLRWIAESLDIHLPNASPAPSPIVQQQHTRDSTATPSVRTQQHLAESTEDRPRDIKSFLNEKQPKSDNQLAAAVAYYFRFEAPVDQSSESISATDLQEAMRLAGRPRLGDPGKTLRNSEAQGYLDRVDRGKYRLSLVGENLVAMTLPGNSDSPAPKKQTRTKRSKVPAKATKSKKSAGKK